MDVFEAIKGRRSVREFLPDEVPQEDLERILDATRYAPTAGNGQPWKFLVMREGENRDELKVAVKVFLLKKVERMGLTPEKQAERQEGFFGFVENIFEAPVLVLVFVDQSQHPDLVLYDGALAVQNMMLAAYALGYGTSFQTTIFPEGVVKDHLAVPERYGLICGVPIGKCAAQPPMPEKRSLDSFVWQEGVPAQGRNLGTSC